MNSLLLPVDQAKRDECERELDRTAAEVLRRLTDVKPQAWGDFLFFNLSGAAEALARKLELDRSQLLFMLTFRVSFELGALTRDKQ